MILRQVSKFWGTEKVVGGELPEFGIKENDMVLDVGGGHRAFIRANVILEKYPESKYDASQRAAQSINIPEGAVFIQGDVSDMSCFRDNQFDFVVCAETLNHVKDPISACKELVRVGKRGYVEIPSALWEIFASHKEHLWLCFWNGTTLSFLKNNYPKNIITDVSRINHKVIEDAYKRMRCCKDMDATFIDFLWKDSFRFKIIRG